MNVLSNLNRKMLNSPKQVVFPLEKKICESMICMCKPKPEKVKYRNLGVYF